MLSIIIPCYGGWNYTKSCLTDLNKLSGDVEIIVVDNGSKDETNKEIKKFRAKHIRLDRNMGYSFANNRAFKESSGDVIMFLNNDIKVITDFENWASKLVCEENTLYSPTGGFIDRDFSFKYETDGGKRPFNYLSGWCLFGLRKTFDQICDENNSPFWNKTFAYFEDTYLSFRAKQLGIELKIQEVPIRHFGRKTSSTMNFNKMYLESKVKFIETCSEERIDF